MTLEQVVLQVARLRVFHRQEERRRDGRGERERQHTAKDDHDTDAALEEAHGGVRQANDHDPGEPLGEHCESETPAGGQRPGEHCDRAMAACSAPEGDQRSVGERHERKVVQRHLH